MLRLSIDNTLMLVGKLLILVLLLSGTYVGCEHCQCMLLA